MLKYSGRRITHVLTTCKTNVLIPIELPCAFISTWRDKLDPSAADGVPPHITLLYPWAQPTVRNLAILRRTIGGYRPFEITFSGVGTFSHSIWLKPLPDTPVSRLMGDLRDAFPHCSPYEGRYLKSRPHLTIANNIEIENYRRLMREVEARLPLTIEIRSIEVWGEAAPGGPWRRVTGFRLGAPA
jgi:2'-5' RNA ligase